jgi:hypothetical protein
MSASISFAGARRQHAAVAAGVLTLAAIAFGCFGMAAAAPAPRAPGDQVWASVFAPPGQLDCRGVAAAPSPDGTALYVAATSATVTGAPRDIVLLKYAADGTLLWQRTFGGPGDDRPAALVLDRDGSIVLAGTEQSVTTGNDVLVTKYSPDGARRWAAHYHGPGSGSDAAASIALGRDSLRATVYVAATTSGVGGSRATILKYTSAGRRLWVRRYAGKPHSAAAAVAADSRDNVYLCGSFPASGDLHGLVVKYGAGGSLRWTAVATGARNRDSFFTDAAVGQGTTVHIYACGERGVPLGGVAMLASYAAGSGRHEWTTLLGSAGLGESAFGAVTDTHNGNAVVVGDIAGAGTTGRQAVIAKYRVRTGATLWMHLFNATATGDDDTLAAVARNGSGDIFAVGTSHTPQGDRMSVLSYSDSGLLRWATLYGGPAGVPAAGNALTLNVVTGAPYAVGRAADGAPCVSALYLSPSSGTTHMKANGSVPSLRN